MVVLAFLATGCRLGSAASPRTTSLTQFTIDDLPYLDASRVRTETMHGTPTLLYLNGSLRTIGGGSFEVSYYKLPGGGSPPADAVIVLQLGDGRISGFTLPARISTDGATYTITTAGATQTIPRAAITSAAYETPAPPKPRVPQRRLTIVAAGVLVGVLVAALLAWETAE